MSPRLHASGVSLVVSVLILAACQPAAAPAPTAAPKPAATAAPAAQPAVKPEAPAAKTEAPAAKAAAPAAPVAPAQSKPSDAPEIKDLKIGVLLIASQTVDVVANKLGYFKDEGFNSVEITALGSGAEFLPAVEAGKLHLVNSAYQTVFVARQQGFDFWIASGHDVATSGPPDTLAVIVKNESPIKTVKDLEGKKVATNSLTGTGWGYTAGVMKRAGADHKKANFVELPFAQMVDALMNDQVDAIAVVDPGHAAALASGKARVIAYPYVEIHPSLDIAGMITTQKWLRANPITAEKYVRALNRSIAYMNANQAFARQEMSEFTKIAPALIEKMLMPVWRTKVDLTKVQGQADLMHELGVLKETPDVSKFVWPTALQ